MGGSPGSGLRGVTIQVAFAAWPSGMDNIHADHELDAKTLRRAVNADVLDSGKIR